MGLTSATGMPVELCNDEDLANGICERGLYIYIYIYIYCAKKIKKNQKKSIFYVNMYIYIYKFY